jgi:hypothetical protein
MAAIDLDLVSLFNEQFGTAPDAFNPKFTAVNGDTALTSVNNGATGAPYWGTDVNGRAMYMPITVNYPTTDASDGLLPAVTSGAFTTTGSSSQVITSWTLPYCVITPSCKKTIVKTPLTERTGTVKELINIEDWNFKIEGFLISPDGVNEFPEADFTTMCRLFEQNVAIEIVSVITDIILMRPHNNASVYVVIEDLAFPAKKGVKHVKPYTMTLVGDTMFNLIDIS